jgi:hypothetical protein
MAQIIPLPPQGTVSYRVCVNDVAVPFVVRTSVFRDINDLAGGDTDGEDFILVCLKATADVRWLEKYLNLPRRWWVHNSGASTVPLMSEIREAINVKQITKGRGCRFERQQNTIVAIRVRGKVILIQNNVMNLNIAFKTGDEIEGLKWFLLQLGVDFASRHEWEAPARKRSRTEEQVGDDDDAHLEGLDEGPPPSSSKQQRHYLGHHEHAIVQTSVVALEEHPECFKAKFLPSRASFMVTKQDRTSKEFVVSGLNKHRKNALIKHGLGPHEDDDLALLAPMFEKSVAGALAFLERLEPE